MIIFLSILIYSSLKNILLLTRNKKVFNNKKILTFNKKNLYKWMNLTKKERYNLSKQDSFNYMNKRKFLLAQIRKEYKQISRENTDKFQR